MPELTSIGKKLYSLRVKLATAPEIWQVDILDQNRFSSLAREYGFMGINTEIIEQLWYAGLLRADLVIIKDELETPDDLILCCSEDKTFVDLRPIKKRCHGYGGVFQYTYAKRNILLYFHPYRLLILNEIVRVISLNISPMQYLINKGGFRSLTENILASLDHWTSCDEFVKRFEDLNEMSEAAIALDPISFPKVFGHENYNFLYDKNQIDISRDTYRLDVSNIFQEDSLQWLESVRQKLCVMAEILDNNKLLHVLLRLTTWHRQRRLKGSVGLAMLFLSMAETIRRALERTLAIELPEEDELGFGQWMEGAREATYGVKRVFDLPSVALREFMSEIGLDYGVKVKCYVEGATEFGALFHAIGHIESINLINLKGQVVERKGKGLMFSNSLMMDAKNLIFSVILLDSDNADYVAAARQAAKSDLIIGRIFFANPDFEFANFSVHELCEVFVALCSRSDLTPLSLDKLLEYTSQAKSAEEFFKCIRMNFIGLDRVGKSEEWGAALMEYAINNPNYKGKERPILDAARTLAHATQIKYRPTRDSFRVDPFSGELVSRTSS